MFFANEWRWFENLFDKMPEVRLPQTNFTYTVDYPGYLRNREEDGRLICELDIPGVKREDLTLEVTRDGVLVTGKRGETETCKERLLIPSKYDPDNAKATLADGVLTLVFEKKEEETPKKKLLPIG